jgi:ATP-binding cassette, subfamily F, member 3
LYKILLPYRQKLESIESEIAKLESRKTEIETMMANPEFFKNGDGAKKISQEYKELPSKLEQKYNVWNQLTEEIAAIEQEKK